MSADPPPDGAPGAGLADPTWRELAARELRGGWVINARARRRAWLWAAFVGAWGVASGYACFILWWEQQHAHEPRKFVLAFVGSLGAALVIEVVRDLLRHGEVEDLRRPSASKILAVLLTASMFELFVLAYHGAADLDSGKAGLLREDLLGPALQEGPGVIRDLVTLAVLWLVVGAVVATVLVAVVFNREGRRAARIARGSGVGALAGVIAAPVAVFAYVLAIRVSLAVKLLVSDPDEWRAHVATLGRASGSSRGLPDALYQIAVALVGLLGELTRLGALGGVLVALAVAGLVWCGIRFSEWRPALIVGLGAAAVVLAPLGEGLDRVALLGLLAAVVWFLPGALLGFCAPLLERPSERPAIWIWSGLGFLAAAVLVLLTWLQVTDPLFLVLAALLAVGGVGFQRGAKRGAKIEEYWPLIALSLAVLVWGLALGFRGIAPTSHAVLDYLHQVNLLPPSVARAVIVTDAQRLDGLFRSRKLAPTPTEALAQLERLTPPEQIKALEALRERVGALREGEYERLRTAVTRKVRHLAEKAEQARMPAEPLPRLWPPGYAPPPPPTAPRAQPVPTDQLMRAACLEGVSLACLDRLDPARWKALEPELAAEVEDALKRPRDWDPASAFWQAYGFDISGTRGALSRLEPAFTQIETAIRSREDADASADRARRVKEAWARQTRAPQQLELCIAGAFAFWVTVALLAAWSIRRHTLVEADAGGAPRCFWAQGDALTPARLDAVRRYHDEEHGRVPDSDRELFERLALDMLVDDVHWERREELRGRVAELAPEAPGVMEPAQVTAEGARLFGADTSGRAAFEAVAGSARWLQAAYRDKAPGVTTGAGRLVLDDWRARARADAGKLVEHIRAVLPVPKTARLGSALQAVGLLGPAHFEGCRSGARHSGGPPGS